MADRKKSRKKPRSSSHPQRTKKKIKLVYKKKDRHGRLVITADRVEDDVIKRVCSRLVFYDNEQKKVVTLVEENTTRDPKKWTQWMRDLVVFMIATEVDTSANPLLYVHIPEGKAEDGLLELVKKKLSQQRGNGTLSRENTRCRKRGGPKFKPTEHDFWVFPNGKDGKSCNTTGLGSLYGLGDAAGDDTDDDGRSRPQKHVCLLHVCTYVCAHCVYVQFHNALAQGSEAHD